MTDKNTEQSAEATRLASDVSKQAVLLNACVLNGRWDWARLTAATIADLTRQLEAQLPSGTPGPVAEKPAAPAKRKWVPPTPAQVKETVLRLLGDRPVVGWSGPLVLCSFNGYHLKIDKAKLMVEPVLEIVRRAHIIFFQETNADALRFIARAAGYGFLVSHRNKREQACGYLFHPRVQWLGSQPVYHDYLLDVPGHPEFKDTLRPAVQRRVMDSVTGFVLDVINFHGKSNVGGPDATRPIRRHALECIVAELERQKLASPYQPRTVVTAPADPAKPAARPVNPEDETRPLGAVVLGGDFNCPLEVATTTEIEPLIQAGFVLAATADGRPTHKYKEHAAQFDGFFSRGLDGRVSGFDVPPFPENKRDFWFFRELSDHLPGYLTIDTTAGQPAAAVAEPAPDAQATQS